MPPTPTPLGRLSNISCMFIGVPPTSPSNIVPGGIGVPGPVGKPKSPPSTGKYGPGWITKSGGGGARKLLNVCLCMSMSFLMSS
jgi:hypothetical protein